MLFIDTSRPENKTQIVLDPLGRCLIDINLRVFVILVVAYDLSYKWVALFW